MVMNFYEMKYRNCSAPNSRVYFFYSFAALLSFIPGQSVYRRQGTILWCRNSFGTGVPTLTQCSLQGFKGKVSSFSDSIHLRDILCNDSADNCIIKMLQI